MFYIYFFLYGGGLCHLLCVCHVFLLIDFYFDVWNFCNENKLKIICISTTINLFTRIILRAIHIYMNKQIIYIVKYRKYFTHFRVQMKKKPRFPTVFGPCFSAQLSKRLRRLRQIADIPEPKLPFPGVLLSYLQADDFSRLRL